MEEFLNKKMKHFEKIDAYVEEKLTYIGEISFRARRLSPLYKYGVFYFVYELDLNKITLLGNNLNTIYLRYGLEERSNISGREEMRDMVLDCLKNSDKFKSFQYWTKFYLENHEKES